MKYHTLIVPVVAFATLASALPSDASAQARPSDQGNYKHRPKQQKQTGPPQQEEIIAAKLAQGGLEKLPVQAPVEPPFNKLPSSLPVNANGLPPSTNGLPVQAPVNGIPPNTNELPVQPPVNGLPNANGIPPSVNGIPPSTNELFVNGILQKLPIQVPPQIPPHVRRSRHHATRDASKVESCGHLRVEASDNKYSGFVSAARDEDGRHTVVKNVAQGTLVDLKDHNLIFRHEDVYPALGATYGVMRDRNAQQDDFQGNSANFAMLTGTSKTLYGKAASSGLSSFNEAVGANQHIESAIYLFGENREIHASWINKDGAMIPAQFGVNPDGQVILGANVGQYAATYGGYSAKLFCQ